MMRTDHETSHIVISFSRSPHQVPWSGSVWRYHQPSLDPDRRVFIDETWATTNMMRRYGRSAWAAVGRPVPRGHWKTSTFVAGLRTTGTTAPLVVDGAMNGDVFRSSVEQVLVPTLAPGDIVILGTIEARAASLVYLPPNSPDLN